MRYALSLASRDVLSLTLAGGITVFAPLKQHGVGPGKRVGIAGIGGLGHFGILFAKALGASKVVAISRSSAKKDDALKLGADDFIATGEEPDWTSTHRGSLDLIVSTVSGPNMPIQQYLDLLAFQGTLVQVGAPEEGLPAFNPMAIAFRRLNVTGSLIGSRKEIREMLQLAAEKGIRPWTQQRAMGEANQVLLDFEKGLPRYRYVLCN